MFNGDPNMDYVLKTVKQRDIHFIRLWFTDVLGQMKSFAITPNELELAFEEGMSFDGGAVSGFSGPDEASMVVRPDASTFQVLPWRPTNDGVARMFCNVYMPDGQPYECDPRFILRRTLGRATEMGYELNVGVKGEYFYFKNNERPEFIDKGGYFDLTPLDNASDLRRDTILTLEKMGIPVEYSYHEAAPSQQEIRLRNSDALSMADAIMTFRLVVKEIAIKHGVYASFMPKPVIGINGSGLHVHQSLFDADDNNVFYDANDPLGLELSETAKHYIAGVLKYADDSMLITNQYVNSYKRLVAGHDAPLAIAWSATSRESMVRVPHCKPGKESSKRFEVRTPDAACNPYLTFAVLLAAGLRGIAEELELDKPITRDAGAAELAGYATLPRDLGTAIQHFEQSSFMQELLGAETHCFLVRNKRAEWQDYCAQVTQWELDRNYPIL